jgi:tetratricopeptide (TPR) repeat protein
VDRKNKDYAELMRQLGGHPLAMRVILPQLEKHSAAEISNALRGNLEELKFAAGDEASEQLFAALRFVEHSLPDSLRPLLLPLSLHEGWVELRLLEAMAKRVPGNWLRAQIDQLAGALGTAGLLTDHGQAIYELHPALTGYLRSHLGVHTSGSSGADEWNRGFVDVMGRFADSLTPRQLHEQRFPFYLHGANFHTAFIEAERLAMQAAEKALTQSLAAWALNNRNFVEAERLFLHLARHEDVAAGAYHQLGMVALEHRDFPAAEQWSRKSLAISERHGNEPDAASTYHTLRTVAQERRDFAAAERWYRKSLAINEKLGNEHGAAMIYHQLGRGAEERRDFAAAEQWYRKSLAISERQGNEHVAAITYHQLGTVAQERRDFAAAEQWYRKSLTITEKQGNEHGAASTLLELSNLAVKQQRLIEAGRLCLRALAIFFRSNDPHSAQGSAANFVLIHGWASDDEKRELEALWTKAGLGPFPPQENS